MVQTRIANLGLHLLINNAGIGEHDTFFTATSQSMERFYKTNAIGPVLVTQVIITVHDDKRISFYCPT